MGLSSRIKYGRRARTIAETIGSLLTTFCWISFLCDAILYVLYLYVFLGFSTEKNCYGIMNIGHWTGSESSSTFFRIFFWFQSYYHREMIYKFHFQFFSIYDIFFVKIIKWNGKSCIFQQKNEHIRHFLSAGGDYIWISRCLFIYVLLLNDVERTKSHVCCM